MTDAVATFEAERPRLRALAYRMLGSMADADDVVQDAWLRWERLGDVGRSAIENPSAWLTTTTSRLALDVLRSARRQREEYVGPWLPEPVLTDDDPAEAVELAESLTLGFLAVLERLEPVERAVFLLADVFGEPYREIAVAVGRSEDACRQIAARARRRVRDEHRHRGGGAAGGDQLLQAFVAACASGEVDALRGLLVDDAVLVSDGGRDVHAARRPIVGADRVSRFLAGVVKRLPSDVTIEHHHVNGEPGLVVRRHGQAVMVLAIEPAGDAIAAVRLVVNPDKLRSLPAA